MTTGMSALLQTILALTITTAVRALEGSTVIKTTAKIAALRIAAQTHQPVTQARVLAVTHLPVIQARASSIHTQAVQTFMSQISTVKGRTTSVQVIGSTAKIEAAPTTIRIFSSVSVKAILIS